ncbi:MAG: NifB/NifX family molybdenum-iron cluster-binding protein [Promethearchaeota archaeon]
MSASRESTSHVVKVAFPSLNGTGLDDEVSPHFGHSPYFTLVTVDVANKKVGEVEVINSAPHQSGGCMVPVMYLKQNQADAVVVGGIGMRPLMGFLQEGITPFGGIQGTVKENALAFLEGKLPMLSQGTCQH